MTSGPPTIGVLRSQGVAGIRVMCPGCRAMATVSFDAIALPDETLFPAIPQRRRLVCKACGIRSRSVMPDWPPTTNGGLRR